MELVKIQKMPEYGDWYLQQPEKIRLQIDARLERITYFGHFGHCKRLSFFLSELKFNNGNRIYFTTVFEKGKTIVLILGGNKNGQDEDIKRAQKTAEKFHVY